MRNETHIVDPFHRTINYMRISVTDRCNLRCLYCMPEEGLPWIPKEEILTYEETTRIVQAIAPLGLKRIRITGGEPLVRKDLPLLVKMLSSVTGIEDVSLSTNGILLAENARALAEAGLHRVNVSLDTLDKEKFIKIARRDRLDSVLKGIEAAEEAGLKPIKINTVVIRGFNEDEMASLARLTLEREWHVRFIEVMPVQENLILESRTYMAASEILERITAELGNLEPCSGPSGNGPALYFRLPGAKGTIGTISPLSNYFCSSCNRVRLTADGRLRLCLFGDVDADLRTPLRQGASKREIAAIFRNAIRTKPERHNLQIGEASCSLRALSQIGG